MAGHVYVLAGDLTRVHCDAWLLPTDEVFQVSRSFAAAIGARPDSTVPGLTWDGRRIVRFPSDARGPAVWLGDVGRSGASASWYAEVVDPFVAAATADLGANHAGEKPLLAVNVLGTGEGGMAADKGDIHRALLPALYDAADRYDVDLALVCWGRRAYAAAQRVRHQLIRDRADDDLAMVWDLGERFDVLLVAARRLAREARHGNLVLFLGAGVSAGAGLPAWQGLLDDIARSLSDPPDLDRLHRLDVRDQAAVLQRRLEQVGRTLHDAVSQRIDRTRYALTHGLLASLPTREAVTTNYDRLFEIAVEPVDGPVAVLPYQPVNAGQRWLLKLHGSIERDASFVLTRSDYLTIPARHSALFGLVQAMLLTRHMCFVGYSLSDEDFHQLVHEVRLARADAPEAARFGTVLALFDDDLFAELWADDVHVVALADQPPGAPTDDAVAAAARRLQIFLDLVAYEAADLDAFLLDPAYDALLDERERALAERLRPFVDSIDLLDDDVPAVARIRRLLVDLGLPAAKVHPPQHPS